MAWLYERLGTSGISLSVCHVLAVDVYKRQEENSGMLTDSTEYLSRLRRTDRLIPVVTLVIYHGEERCV